MIDLEQHYETLLLESPADAVLQLTLNRPERLNAMTVTMFDELESVARAIADETWHVVHQDRSAWSFNVELRPFGEKW